MKMPSNSDSEDKSIVKTSAAELSPSAGPPSSLRLNLGCGSDYLPGYINIDANPAVLADLHLNLLDIDTMFAPASVCEILLIHSLNYLNLWQAQDFFRKAASLLLPDGILIIETPNLLKAVDKIRACEGTDSAAYLEGVRALHAFDINQIKRREQFTPYAFSWSPWHLEHELSLSGFENIKILPPKTHSPWRDMRIEAQKTVSHNKVKPGRSLLILGDSMMGHATIQVRGASLVPSFIASGWAVEMLDYCKSTREQVISAAIQADIVYLLKISDLGMVQQLKKGNAKIVFDLTDALWMAYHQQRGWHDLDGILRIVDAIISDNQYVAQYGKQFTSDVYVVPCQTNVERFISQRAQLFQRKDLNKITLGWIGSQGTAGGLNRLRGCLEKLALRHPNLQLCIVGADQSAVPDIQAIPVTFIPTYDEDSMIREVLRFDIGLFPPSLDLEDYIVRGSLKAGIYMSAGVPPVCYNAGECADIIEDGITGMLAKEPDEWEEKLEKLISSPELRRQIGENAQKQMFETHTISILTDRYSAIFEEIIASSTTLLTPTATSPRRPRILLIADVPNWIFARHCTVLNKLLSDEFEFDLKLMGQPYEEGDYDLIYPLEFNLIPFDQIKTPAKYVTGIRSHISWTGYDFLLFAEALATKFQRVHCVSQRLTDMFRPFVPNLHYVTHGTDTSFFTPTTRVDQGAPGRIRIGWAGNRVCKTKGFEDIVVPLGNLPSVELIYCGYQDKNLDLEGMRQFYDSIDCYVCTSSVHHEGNNNSLMEAAAMERAIITTDNGTVPEYLRQSDSAIIVERELPNFIHAVCVLRDDPVKRGELGRQARIAVKRTFDWSAMAPKYAEFFWQALNHVGSWSPPHGIASKLVMPQSSTSMSTEASERDIESAKSQPLSRDQYIGLAMEFHQAGQLDQAEVIYRQILSDNKNDFAAIHMLGVVCYQRGDLAQAEQLLKRALAMNNVMPEVHYNLGNVFMLQSRNSEARACFTQALVLNKNFTLATQQLMVLNQTR